MSNDRGRTTVQLGDLIAALYEEAEKVTKEKRLQLLLVRLALMDLNLRSSVGRKSTHKAA